MLDIKVGDKVRIFYEDEELREDCADHDQVGIVIQFPWKSGLMYKDTALVTIGTYRRPYGIRHLKKVKKQC